MEEQPANISVRTGGAGLDPPGMDAEPSGTMSGRGQGLVASQAQPTDGLMWMVNVGGQETVEMSTADIEAAWRSGRIDGSTLVWRETMADWTPVAAVPLLRMEPPAPRGDSATEPSEPPASRPASPSADPRSSDFAAAKRRRRSSVSGVPSAKPGPKLASTSRAPHAANATLPSGEPRSAHDATNAAPLLASASLAELTTHAIAMVDPHSDEVGRPSSPWALRSARPEMPAPSEPRSDADAAPAAGATAAIGDATFEKDFEQLWANGLDPNPADRAPKNDAAASDPNFEADFAELWAQGPQPTAPVAGAEQPVPGVQREAAEVPDDGGAKLAAAEPVLQPPLETARELDVAVQVEPSPPAGITVSSAEPTRAPGIEQPAAAPQPAAPVVLPALPSLHDTAEAHRPSFEDLHVSGERDALIPPSENKPKSGPSIESLRDLRPAAPHETGHLTPLPSHPAGAPELGHVPVLSRAPARAEVPPPISAGELARPSGSPPAVRPPPPRSHAARQGMAPPHDTATQDKGETRRSSLPSLSRPSLPARTSLSPNAPPAALGSSPSSPSGPHPPLAPAGDAPPIAIFQRPSATLVFGEPQPATPVRSGPPPFPVPSPSATVSPVPTAAPSRPSATASPPPLALPSLASDTARPAAAAASSATASPVQALAASLSAAPSVTPSVAPSPPVLPATSDSAEEDFVLALKGGKMRSLRALAGTVHAPGAWLTRDGRLSRKAVIGLAAGAVFVVAFVLSLTLSSKDSTESASAEQPPSAAEARSPASPQAPSANATGTSEPARGSRDARAPSSLSRAMKRALTGASRPGAKVASADGKPGSDQDLHRELDKTLDEWNSGAALPKDEVAPPKTRRPAGSIARRPLSRTPRSNASVPPPSSNASDNAPRKTAWDPTNPGF
jgi:hypothetical protein